METFVAERAAAFDAAETLGVPVLVKSGDHFVQYGFAAVGAVRREEREVVRLAVRSSVLLEEVAAAQLRLALCAHKVLRVPHLPQRRHHLSNDRFLTGGAVSFGGRLNSLSAQV